MKRVLLLVVMLTVAAITVNAQSNQRGRQFRGIEMSQAIEAARSGLSQASPDVTSRIKRAFADSRRDNPSERKLVGTWNVIVPGDAPFEALHTFGEDGTFVETSSLLGQLAEGPSHGVWEYKRRGGAVLTFELFIFDPAGNHVGRVRVRNFIRLVDEDNFVADSAVDIIELDGTVIPDVATASYTGTRMKLRGL
jgi:hypothetical protein